MEKHAGEELGLLGTIGGLSKPGSSPSHFSWYNRNGLTHPHDCHVQLPCDIELAFPVHQAVEPWSALNVPMTPLLILTSLLFQINDPDAGLWIVVYVVPAVLTLLVGLNPSITDNVVWRSLSDLHSAACLVGTIALGCSLFAYAKSNILHEEEGRELFGLVIITIWMNLCRNSAKNPLGGIRLMAAISLSLFPFVTWLYIYMNSEMRSSWPTHCKTVI
ncbi:transmembrane protein 220 [Terrapene carolina triunguis]|uniref:transmembrane protein 220 n=1 Tax=Terrapene triunguis TaxID=2587831 RepID=UPI000E77B0CC|nr:transmembrane protein 220 [Terrapene carolina triunguis]